MKNNINSLPTSELIFLEMNSKAENREFIHDVLMNRLFGYKLKPQEINMLIFNDQRIILSRGNSDNFSANEFDVLESSLDCVSSQKEFDLNTLTFSECANLLKLIGKLRMTTVLNIKKLSQEMERLTSKLRSFTSDINGEEASKLVSMLNSLSEESLHQSDLKDYYMNVQSKLLNIINSRTSKSINMDTRDLSVMQGMLLKESTRYGIDVNSNTLVCLVDVTKVMRPH